MTWQIRHILRPVLLWALHFIAVYALISAACAPRGLIEADVMRATAAVLTGAACGLVLIWAVQSQRVIRVCAAEAAERPLLHASLWSAVISGLGLLANLAPIALMTTCTG